MTTTLRIATRKSPLALWQANYVKHKLTSIYPELTITLLEFVTEGDRRLDESLSNIGGKGLFVKELEKSLIQEEADIAVHSIKDMPFVLPEALTLGAVCEREDPRDAFVSNLYDNLDMLPQGARVGTSSARRSCLLTAYRPDLKAISLRGNVGTRLNKLDEGEYDAIILAAAGLKRLDEENRIKTYLDTQHWIPAPGQGAIGVECRKNDARTLAYLSVLEDEKTRRCITAERAVNEALEGGCQLPIAVHATCSGSELFMQALVGHPKKNLRITANISGSVGEEKTLGAALAEQLLMLGAGSILDDLRSKF